MSELERPSLRPLRDQLEDAIERAVETLNAIDGDPDFEPSLGSLNCIGRFVSPIYANTIHGSYDQTRWAAGANDDREQNADDEREIEADCENWKQRPQSGPTHKAGDVVAMKRTQRETQR